MKTICGSFPVATSKTTELTYSKFEYQDFKITESHYKYALYSLNKDCPITEYFLSASKGGKLVKSLKRVVRMDKDKSIVFNYKNLQTLLLEGNYTFFIAARTDFNQIGFANVTLHLKEMAISVISEEKVIMNETKEVLNVTNDLFNITNDFFNITEMEISKYGLLTFRVLKYNQSKDDNFDQNQINAESTEISILSNSLSEKTHVSLNWTVLGINNNTVSI
jgi:hypothetical protein